MVRESSSARWTPWRVVLSFGIVSLLADMVYEGARSMYGPLLASLGASAFVVGLVTGAGEAMALVLRLATGPMADRRGGHWSFTIGGYGLTAICVPFCRRTAPRGGRSCVRGADDPRRARGEPAHDAYGALTSTAPLVVSDACQADGSMQEPRGGDLADRDHPD